MFFFSFLNQTNTGGRVDRVMEEVKIGLECFFVLWLVLGIFWISFGNSSPSDAPNLYRFDSQTMSQEIINYSLIIWYSPLSYCRPL